MWRSPEGNQRRARIQLFISIIFPDVSTMQKFSRPFQLALLATAALLAQSAFAQSYKCKGADGRIEYSDRPCATDKDQLSQPRGSTVTSKSLVNPMEQLAAAFKEYEPRLCEREKLATEIDTANRAGEISKNPTAWKARQERLSNLNEVLVEFQGKTGKYTRVAGNDSDEATALRKFQSKLKECAKPPAN